MMMRTSLAAATIAALASSAAGQAYVANDFPTEARADYVFACMASNGTNAETLRRCSCSIDTIASILSYEDYVNAETVMRTIQVTGERVAAFRTSARHTEMVANLRRAQAEADIVCF
jgi:lysyl-tRNA synthetase class II